MIEKINFFLILFFQAHIIEFRVKKDGIIFNNFICTIKMFENKYTFLIKSKKKFYLFYNETFGLMYKEIDI